MRAQERVAEMAEKDLLELFDKASKAASNAFMNGGLVDAEEARCTEALKAIRAVDVSTSLLLSTQVGKRLRKLTKHTSLKISASAQELLGEWKKVVEAESDSKKILKKISPSDSSSPSPQPDKLSTTVKDITVKSTKITQIKLEVKVTRVESKNVNAARKVDQQNVDSVPAVPLPSSSLVEFVPRISEIPKAGGDAARDRIRELMVEALAKVCKEAKDDDLEKARNADVVEVAVAVENALYSKLGLSRGKEKAKYRSIMFNIKDDKNPDFRRRVLLGKIKPEAVVTMTSDDMASDQRRKETEDIRAKAMFECERGAQHQASTDQFKCAKCGQRKATYFQMQTRSADEPMTTFVTCMNCNAHWKFC